MNKILNRIIVSNDVDVDMPKMMHHAGMAMIMDKVDYANRDENAIKHYFTMICYDYTDGMESKDILNYNEIYLSYSIVPSSGFGHNEDGKMMINAMMKYGADKNISGKKIYLMRDYKSIRWSDLNPELVSSFFKSNELYVSDSIACEWRKIEIETLVEFELEYSPKQIIPPPKKSAKKKK